MGVKDRSAEATLTEDERAELKRLRRSTLASLPSLFDEIGDAIAAFEASSTSEDERAGARVCLRLVAKIRERWIAGHDRESVPTCERCHYWSRWVATFFGGDGATSVADPVDSSGDNK